MMKIFKIHSWILFVGILSLVSTTFAQNSTDLNGAHIGLFDIQVALVLYVALEDVERVEQLLERGVDPNVKASSASIDQFCGRILGEISAISCATYTGNKDMIRLLIRHGANVNSFFGKYGRSPFELALVTHGDLEMVDIIVDAPTFNAAIDKEFSGSQRQSYLELAIRHGRPSLIQTLLDKGAKVDRLRPALHRIMINTLRSYETATHTFPNQ